eukprot:gene5334-9143_t
MKFYSPEEVKQHNTEDDCWIIVRGEVYDVTKFVKFHPGGKGILLNVAGLDATKEFEAFHKLSVLQKYSKLVIGTSSNSTPKLSSKPVIVYGEPSNTYLPNPYYNESHIKFRKAMRKFVEKEILPNCDEWEERKQVPPIMRKKAYEYGFLAGVIGGGWPTDIVGDNIAGGVKPEEWNSFHEIILYDELSRCGSGGVVWGFIGGVLWGFIRSIMTFGSNYHKDLVIKPVLQGEKGVCLCITEPYAGSDVSNIKTTAKKTSDGEYYILNGMKKWITNGTFADFFVVAARTGGDGMKGISVFLLEKSMPGLKVRQMNCTGMWSSGTSYVTFDNMKIPKRNMIGKENEGFKYIMYNFNHERWSFLSQCLRFCRVCYEEAFAYANKRETFGKKLIDAQVIRAKLGNMARQIEAANAWLEHITYQMTLMSHDEQNIQLSGPIAICKTHITLLFEYCTRESIQIFGGNGYTRGGQGVKIERLYRDVHAYAIGGGSEEVLLDLGVRQAMKSSKL